MPTKSKKAAAKKAPAKTPSKKSVARPPKARPVDVEIVSEIPNLMSPDVMKQIAQVEGVIGEMETMTASAMLEGIRSCATRASKFSHQAVQAGASALVYAWACGKLLNAAKGKHGHGDFGKWREKNLGNEVVSERTSQRYMRLAKQCENVKALLEWSSSLRQAYIACGILPEPPEREAGDEGDNDQIKRETLLSSITGIQKKLRLFAGLKGKLGAADKTQLKLAKREIDSFFDQILG